MTYFKYQLGRRNTVEALTHVYAYHIRRIMHVSYDTNIRSTNAEE